MIVVLSINFFTLGLLMLRQRSCSCPKCPTQEEKIVEKVVRAEGKVIKSSGPEESIFLYGLLKREKIPEDLDMGEYRYTLHFSEPHLLLQSSSGGPKYIEDIQLNVSEDTVFYYKIEDLVGKDVEVYGFKTYGLAETDVFQIEAIREY